MKGVVSGRYAKRLPLVKAWKLFGVTGKHVGYMGVDMLGGEWYKRAGGKHWRTVAIPYARRVEAEVK